MIEDAALGFAQAIQLSSLIATAIGVLLGLIVGMIPGMTISTGIIIVLPMTFTLDPNISIALLLGLYVAGMTGGSFSAILLNIPGTPSASATAIDGYPLTERGEAGEPQEASTRSAALACSTRARKRSESWRVISPTPPWPTT